MELTGRLTADAKVAETSRGNKLVRFSVATNTRYKTSAGEWKEITTFFNCAYWRNTGIAEYLVKGGLVELSGDVNASAYKDATGEAKANLNFHVDRIKLHGGTKLSGTVPSETHTEPAPPAPPEDALPF